MKEKIRMAVKLFLFFAKIGCFTFGGGWGIVAEMQKEFVGKKHWITEEELLDYTSIGKSIPGTMISNVSYLFGYRMGGVTCGIASLLGITIMPLIILSIVVYGYDELMNNIYVVKMMTGIRAAVIPIMGYAVWQLCKVAFTEKICYAIAFASFCLYCFTSVQSFLTIFLGALIGILVMKGKK